MQASPDAVTLPRRLPIVMWNAACQSQFQMSREAAHRDNRAVLENLVRRGERGRSAAALQRCTSALHSNAVQPPRFIDQKMTRIGTDHAARRSLRRDCFRNLLLSALDIPELRPGLEPSSA